MTALAVVSWGIIALALPPALISMPSGKTPPLVRTTFKMNSEARSYTNQHSEITQPTGLGQWAFYLAATISVECALTVRARALPVLFFRAGHMHRPENGGDQALPA